MPNVADKRPSPFTAPAPGTYWRFRGPRSFDGFKVFTVQACDGCARMGVPPSMCGDPDIFLFNATDPTAHVAVVAFEDFRALFVEGAKA